MVFCNHNTMRGSCCLRCIHLLFLLIFLLSISTLSINLYLSTFYQFISTRLIFIILCLNFSNFSNFSVTYQLSANLSRSVNFCGGLALASLGFAECFDISTFRHFDISPSTLALRPSFRSAYVRPEKVAQMLKTPRHRAGPEEM